MIDVIDFGFGNTRSVVNWLTKLNLASKIVHRSCDLESKLIILPGVGSAGPYMAEMKRLGFDKRVIEHVNNGSKIIGICLGLQILTSGSEEDGGVEGLNLINGRAEKIGEGTTHNEWEPLSFTYNSLKSIGYNREMGLTRKKKYDGRVFYNHEYGVRLDEGSQFMHQVSNELEAYAGLVITKNLIGMQFHPEKSQKGGSEILQFLI